MGIPIQHSILLVDDEVAVRNLYHLFFENYGFRVICASSVGEALRLLGAEIVSLALVDIFLDSDNGLDLLRGITAARPHLPVIIMSGIDPGAPEFEEARTSGAAAVFSKTRPLHELLTSVQKLLAY